MLRFHVVLTFLCPEGTIVKITSQLRAGAHGP